MNDTGSRLTKILGTGALAAWGAMMLWGLVISGPEVFQRDSVRLLYIHVPSVFAAYTGFGVTLLGSLIYLRNKSRFWDIAAHAGAEIGTLFMALVLITGALWGRPTWGVYWQWDPRMTSTAVLFVTYLGYLALRNLDLPREVRSRRAAVVGIVSFLNVIIVRYSVQWWRSLHQETTFGLDTQLDDSMLFSWFLGTVAMMLTFGWLLVHRFRLGWLESQVEEQQLSEALAERRADAGIAVGSPTKAEVL